MEIASNSSIASNVSIVGNVSVIVSNVSIVSNASIVSNDSIVVRWTKLFWIDSSVSCNCGLYEARAKGSYL